jgi:hypothetical protein
VDEQHLPAGQPDDQVLASPLDRVDVLAGEARRDPGGVVGARQPGIIDASRLDPTPLESRSQPPALGLDLRELGH